MMAFSAERSTEPSVAKDSVAFIKRKFFSLMPNMIIAHLIAFAVYLYFSSNISLTMIFENAVSSLPEMLLFKQSGIKGLRLNGVTWYLSSMLLVMAILYPLLKHFGDRFVNIIAPIGFLMLGGYLFKTYGSLSDLEKWNGWTYLANLRAMADILGGVVCYRAVKLIQKYKFETWMRVLLTALEHALYIGCIAYTYSHVSGKADYVILFCFMIAIVITVSGCGIGREIYKSKVFGWLGKFSLSLYLGHSAWRKYKMLFPRGWDFNKRLALYIFLSLLTALFIMYASIGLRSLWRKLKPKIVSAMVAPEPEK